MRHPIILLTLAIILIPSVAPAQSGFSAGDYADYLTRTADIPAADMLSSHAPEATYFETAGKTLLEQYAWLDSVTIKYKLTPGELTLLETNGFVATERLSYTCFGQAFHDIYANDMPVFVTTDAVLHALHSSYDRILKTLELDVMEPNLARFLDGMYDAFPDLVAAYSDTPGMEEALMDADLYVTMARSLLAGTKGTVRYAPQTTFDDVWDAAAAETMASMPLFSVRSRNLDFSQFIPRGHYTFDPSTGESLENYFRAMMWLGRMDFLLTPPPENPYEEPWTDSELRRMALGASLVNELIGSADVRGLLDENERIITFMVGPNDNLTPAEFDEILGNLGLTPDGLLDDTSYDALRSALETAADAGQRILSNFLLMDPYSTEPGTLPVSYRLLGQRFTIDSFVFSNVVFDRIVYDGKKIWRPMPDPLDAMFVLGNDDALQLLSDDLEKFHYSSQLGALRYLVDAYDEGFWEESLYNTWLGSLRTLNPPQENSAFPAFMRTAAWQQEKLNTQLASWAQLRHDTLLYAKQSYTGGTACSFPHSFVEPYPAFYRTLGEFAAAARTFFAPYEGRSRQLNKLTQFFNRFETHMAALEELARKELAGEPFTESERDWLSRMLFISGYSGAPPFDGWYAELYYVMEDAADVDYTIADVHTQPTDEMGFVVGNVLHVGVGKVNLGVFLAPSPSADGAPTAFVGPVMSYYQNETTEFDRLTDERWADIVNDNALPDRPDWVNSFLADDDGSMRPAGRTLPAVPWGTVDVAESPRPSECILVGVAPNPFNPSATISFTLPETGRAVVEVFNLAGQRVAVLANGPFAAGNHALRWEADGMASGVYIAVVRAGGKTGAVKLTLLR